MSGHAPAITRLCDENVLVRRKALEELDLALVPNRFALRHVLVTDEDAEMRARAAHRLGEARIRRAIPALVEATSDPLPSVRDQALRALGRLGAKDLSSLAADAIRHEPVWWVRRTAIRAAATALKKDALSPLIEALSDPFWRVRHAAVQALAALGEDDPDVQQEVRRAEPLEHQQSSLYTNSPVTFALRYLNAVWNGEPVDETPLTTAASTSIPFVHQPFADEDPAVVTARLELADDADVPSRALVVWLGNPHAPLRALARRKLRQRNDVDALLDALRWLDEPRVPHAAAEIRAICDRLGADDITLARRVLARQVTPGPLMWAAEVASLRGCTASIEHIRTLAREGTPDIRRAAIRGLLRDERSLDAVLAALHDPDAHVRSTALVAWENRPHNPRVIDAWVEALLSFAPKASTVRERRAVVEAAAINGDEAMLKRALEDADPSVVATALSALGAMTALGSSARTRALDHEDPWIRAAALDVQSSLRVAITDPDPWVCRSATDLVVRNRAQVSPNELHQFALAGALHADPWVRARVAELLDPLGAWDDLRALLRLSADATLMVRAAAASVLEQATSLQTRLSALLDAGQTDETVRKSAFTWLLRYGDDTAFLGLVQALEADAEQDEVTKHLEVLSLVFPHESFEQAPHLASRRPTEAPRVEQLPRRTRQTQPAPSLRPLGRTGIQLSPLVLSGAHGLPAAACAEAFDAGVRAFFWEPRYLELSRFLRSRRTARDSLVVVAGTYFAGPEAIRLDVERTLRRLRCDYIDVFLLFWVRSSERLSGEDFDALDRLRAEGKLRAFGFSTHDRAIGVDALNRAPWPVVMTRHNAAHPGAEERLFPTALEHGTGLLTFTATCYGRMLRPTGGPDEMASALPTAPDCYRYSLSQPGVSATLTAPRDRAELFENLEVLQAPILAPEVALSLREHGARVRTENRRFDSLVRRAPGGPHDRLRELLGED